ncbi:MAG: hypothetical protein M3R17_14100 [Bacteroidota bacterium]|nr:hypothetical protein [Bacteroidota bacterium]
MLHLSNEFIKANKEVLHTWSLFVLKCEERNETQENIRTRLAANHLTPDQIEMLMDPDARLLWPAKYKGKTNYRNVAIVLFILAVLIFIVEISVKNQFPFKSIALGVMGVTCIIKYDSN